MTRDKDRKRLIRSRMEKTGESYTAARAQLLSKQPGKKAPMPAIDYAQLAGMADDKVAAKTGRTWQEWTRALDSEHASAMTHRDIAVLVSQKYGAPDWWAQTVTVGYERIKGLRERGQRRGGAYEAGKSRTFDVPVATLFEAWADKATRKRWLDIDPIVRTATAPKSMRLQWPDGTLAIVGFLPKGTDRSAVAVTHTKLKDKAASAKAKDYWSGRLDALACLLAR